MAHPVVRLREDGLLRPSAQVADDVRAAVEAGTGWVVLDHGRAPIDLDAALAALLPLAADPLAAADGPQWADREALRASVARGLRALAITTVGDWRELLEAAAGLDHLRVILQLPLVDGLDPAEVVALAAAHGAAVDLFGAQPPHGPAVDAPFLDAAGQARAAQVAWEAARTGVPLRAFAIDSRYHELPPSGGPHPIDANLLQLLRAAVRLPDLPNGTCLGPASAEAEALVGGRHQLGRLLGSVGWPVVDLPTCHAGLARGPGGPRCEACPPACPGNPPGTPEPVEGPPAPCTGTGRRVRVTVLVPPIADGLLVHGTLPGLATELRALGAEVRLHSAWHRPFCPNGLDPDSAEMVVDDTPMRAWAESHVKAFVRSLDLGDSDLVVVPGFKWGEVVLRHRTLRPDARVVLADLHLLEDIQRWKRRWLGAGKRSLGTDWWPSDNVHVHACFPGLARLYWYASVPLRQVTWRPYPTSDRHMGGGPRASSLRALFAGGAHLRDHATLVRGVELAGDGPPIHLYSPGRPVGRMPARLGFHGIAPLPIFHDAIRNSRAVIVTVKHHDHRAAGISVVAMARAAGRPVIASNTPGLADHVRHEVDGLLVPPGDPEALAAALRRIERDDDLVDHLAAGSRDHGALQDVALWAREILDGARLPAPVPHPHTGGAPWLAW